MEGEVRDGARGIELRDGRRGEELLGVDVEEDGGEADDGGGVVREVG